MDDDPDDLVDQEKDYGPAGRPPPPRKQKFTKRDSLPTVERSLDKFIETAKAEPHKHDVTYFDPDTREETMRKEIEDLKGRVAAAEARAATALEEAKAARTPVPAPAPPPAPVATSAWGKMAVAFVIGGACMFGVNALWPRKDVVVQQADRGMTVQPIQPISAEPIQEPPKPLPPPVADPIVADTKITAAPIEKPRPLNKITTTTIKRPSVPRDPIAKPPDPTPPKPADPKPADPGLYNPFGTNP
jgi:hypothetical protein